MVVCACTCGCVRACVCACVRTCVRACVCVRVWLRAQSHAVRGMVAAADGPRHNLLREAECRLLARIKAHVHELFEKARRSLLQKAPPSIC
eukprot:6214359-Pleurochrysis_carterae.AAC.3